MGDNSGVAGFVKAAAWLTRFDDLEVLSFGRAGDAPAHSCRLEMVGDFLAFDVTLDGGFVFVRAQPCDSGDPPQLLVTFPDGPQGWADTCRFVSACIRNQIKSLERPIEIGEGKDGYVIGD